MSGLWEIFAAKCGSSGFLGFPKWYKGLKGGAPETDPCNPQLESLSDIWLVVINFIEILLRLAGLLAIGFIIYGGIMFVISQGEPERIKNARSILANAITGLIIAILATTIVNFIAGRF